MRLPKSLVAFTVLLLSWGVTLAQCPMCKAVAQSAQRETGRVSTLNDGILYLFVLPYLTIGVIGFLWYRRYRKLKAQTEA